MDVIDLCSRSELLTVNVHPTLYHSQVLSLKRECLASMISDNLK